MATRIISVAIAGVGLLALSTYGKVAPRLVWNASASAPMGLYWVAHAPVQRGALVLAIPPESMRRLATERGYLPAGVPLVKRIAALSGDQICADGDQISINGRVVVQRRETDSMGRPMPIWTGCRTLSNEVFLLLEDVPDSFDGRYFGPVPGASVIGNLIALWTP